MNIARYLLLLIPFLVFSCGSEKEVLKVTTSNLSPEWEFREVGSEKWLKANVPGCVHTDLLNNNVIDNPYLGTNEDSVQWIHKKNWEYKTTIDVNEQVLRYNKIELIFNGIDTYSDIYINDSLVSTTDNMYRLWEINAKKVLQPGKNEIRVILKSPINEARPLYTKYNGLFPAINEKSDSAFSPYTRKAPFHYGWDWGPKLITMGIWKPVQLRYWDEAIITDNHLRTHSINKASANYSNHIEVDASHTQIGKLVIEVSNPYNIDGHKSPDRILITKEKEVEISPGKNFFKIDFSIPEPQLWWPNGSGEQPLYHITTKLLLDEQEAHSVSKPLGIREIELVQNADSLGKSFYFRVNGKPIFMKGANSIPQEVFPTKVTTERQDKLLTDAVKTHMNMLRVWGGAIYESDEFYDLCDKKGLLIWQDFMFACAFYPADDTLAYTIKKEAVENVKRLRHHPCIALYCGNNEIEHGWYSWGWKEKYQKDSVALWSSYDRIFNHILPNVVSSLSPEVPYISTSPLNMEEHSFEKTSGDHHEWKIWFGNLPFSAYDQRVGRFNSEYGFQSFPDYRVCQRMTRQDTVDMESAALLNHQKCHMDWYSSGYTGNDRIKDYMSRYYTIPSDPKAYTIVSQYLQADALETAMDAHRRNKDKCMGSLFWQINDCWPAISWSTIDYYGNWKLSHYKVKESFKPVIVNCIQENDSIRVYLMSDFNDTISSTRLNFRLQLFNGEILQDTSLTINIIPNSSSLVYSIPLKGNVFPFNRNYLVASAGLFQYKDLMDEDVLYFTEPKNLILHNPIIYKRITEIENGYIIELKSDTLAKGVHIEVPEDATNCFSDNYFDLLPGKKKTIKFIKRPFDTKKSDFSIRQLTDFQ